MTQMGTEATDPCGETAGLHRRREAQPTADQEKHIDGDFFQGFGIENGATA